TSNSASTIRSSSSRWPSNPTMRWLPGTRIRTDASCSRLPGAPVPRAGVRGAGPPGAGLMACERAKVRARVVEPEPTRSPRKARARELPSARSATREVLTRGGGGGPEAELLEPGAELFHGAAHARRQHPEVGTANREHAAVEVLAFALQRPREPIQDVSVGLVELVQAHQVDGELGVRIHAVRVARLDEADLALELTRQQLVGRYLVDLGEAKQPRHRDRTLAALVGAEHGRLELEARARLDVVQ